MYSIIDYNKAREEELLTLARIEIAQQRQEKERSKAEAILNKLYLEMEPLKKAYILASDHLKDIRRRLLGPWDVNQYHSARMFKLGGKDEYWDNRVWMRMVKRDNRNPEWQWEAQIRGFNGHGDPDSKDVILGPASGSRNEDLEKQQRKTEKLLVEMGYILYTGEE